MSLISGIYFSGSIPTLANGAASGVRIDSQGQLLINFPSALVDTNGYLKVAEQYAPVAEDNSNGVIATVNKPLAISTYAPSTSISLAAATTATAKAAAGNVFSLKVVNRNAAARYLLLFNTTSATTPILDGFLIPGASMVVIGTDYFTLNGMFFSTGITWGMSTGNGSYVAATASETDVTILYK